MAKTGEQTRTDALAIWRAAVARVDSRRLVRENVRLDGQWLDLAGQRVDLLSVGRILVVGAGKAGAGMAAGLLEALGPRVVAEKHLDGWIHVPADCVVALAPIHLHPARPAGINEPTPEGVQGAREMLRRLEALQPDDLCIALFSGGGSALLPLPAEGITLDDKLAVTRFLSAAGATIDELNTVRKQTSAIKGGKLARACHAGRLVTLVISDVLGDPLDMIASGPTVADASTPDDALAVLERYHARQAGIAPAVFELLARNAAQAARASGAGQASSGTSNEVPSSAACQVTNVIIGNNRLAVDAAAEAARRLGYRTEATGAIASEGPAEAIGRRLAEWALATRARASGPACLVDGGEPTVKLVESARRRLGGRNQQIVLAAAEVLMADGGARRL